MLICVANIALLLVSQFGVYGLGQPILEAEAEQVLPLVAVKPGEDLKVDSKPRLITLKPVSSVRLITEKKNKKFWIFEVHSRQFPVLLSYRKTIEPDKNEYLLAHGTDPGLVYPPDILYPDQKSDSDPYVYLKNPQNVSFTVMVLVRGYTAEEPLPGGCVLPYQPSLSVSWDTAVVNLSFSHAGLFNLTRDCNKPHTFQYEVFQLYLPERALEDKQFFRAMQGFLEIEGIRKHGYAVQSLTGKVNHIVFSAYPATGSLYAVVVTHLNNKSSVYVSSHTYACNLDISEPNNCEVLFFTITKILCALAVFAGLFMGFAGHRFFKCSQFIFGFYAGSFIGYILLNVYLEEYYWFGDWVSVFALTTACGLTLAGLVSAMWWFLGIPVLSVLLPTLVLGVLAASCVMFLPMTDVPTFTSTSTYWLVFACIVLAGPVLLLAFTQKASILSCVIIGVYTVIVPVDHYLGSNLRYILVNVLRRATVPEFRLAINAPPAQTPDLVLLVCGLGAMAGCLVVQLVVERRKAPFPPAPYQQWRWTRETRLETAEERTPLVRHEVSGTEEDTSDVAPTAPVVGFILGYRSINASPANSPRQGSSSSLQGLRRQRLTPSSARDRDIFKPPSPEYDVPRSPA